MAEQADTPAWISERLALIALALLSAGLATFIVLPYLKYVLLAGVIAYVFTPAQRALERRIGPLLAAVLLTGAAIVAVLLPIGYLLLVTFREGTEFAAVVQGDEFDLETVEAPFEAVGLTIELDDLYATYREPIATGLQGVATETFEIVGGLPSLFIGLTVTVFVLFSLLRDGDRFLAWIVMLLPFDDEITRELIVELDRLMWASIVGNVIVAVLQAALLGIGLLVIGVPGVAFLTVAAFVLALLPLIGPFGVWLPVSVYLLLAGRPLASALLFGYGVAVSTADNYLRPAMIGHSGELNAAIVIVGIFGGIAVFGFVGLFVGPVVLGCAKVVLDVFATA
ncbi:AI-2E family transporter [Haloterrigena salifodinae]|uniref:AI-2E family transporter n=1 Tax=Haloterrigena salifodinae TaxID=2675099 RepID=A0A8T8E527_9EURY|nr:AI-2E family transporter [Haloterrigena salifodinae]QRV16975.1 AI-2E family transporter [Haloterrigena salifodinae]